MDRETSEELELDHHRLHIVEQINETYQVGDFKIKGFPLVHDSAGGTGFLLKGNGKKIAYITDTRIIKSSFRGLSHLMIEANYSWQILKRKVKEGVTSRAKKTRVIENHLSLEDVENFLRNIDRSKLREVRLLHLSSDNSDRELFKRRIKEEFGIPTKVAEKASSKPV